MPLRYGKGNFELHFELQFTSLSVCLILQSKDTGIFHSEMSITVKIYDSTRVLYEHITPSLSAQAQAVCHTETFPHLQFLPTFNNFFYSCT